MNWLSKYFHNIPIHQIHAGIYNRICFTFLTFQCLQQEEIYADWLILLGSAVRDFDLDCLPYTGMKKVLVSLLNILTSLYLLLR